MTTGSGTGRGGAHPKQLGVALERRLVQRATKAGIPAKRQPYSGAVRSMPNDVLLFTRLGELHAECKVRSVQPHLTDMLSWLYKAQEHARRVGALDAFLCYNTKGESQPKVLLDLDTFLKIVSCTIDKQESEAV